MSTTSTLLQNGKLLIHDDQLNVSAVKADMLIKDGTIVQIERSITPAEDTHVLDCTDKLLTPGFIDTHHHLWQTSLKGRHGEQTLLEYYPSGVMPNSVHTADEAFWGQLAGALESLAAGTTTVVDHAHNNVSPAHALAAIRATALSGLRAFYCYTPTQFVESWAPFKLNNATDPWVMQTYAALAAAAPFAAGRVQLGFAFDATFLPQEALQPLFGMIHQTAKVITHHAIKNAMVTMDPLTDLLAKSLLPTDPEAKVKTIISHDNSIEAAQTPTLQAHGISISVTPSTELSTGMASPVPRALSDPALDAVYSLGADCHAGFSAFLPEQARALLLARRAAEHSASAAEGKWHARMTEDPTRFPSARRAFNMLTVGGARAVGMEGELGQLKVGYKADVVVWDATSPALLGAVETDPVNAVVWHASTSDVSGVLVDGQVRKWEGKLADVHRANEGHVADALQAYQLPIAEGADRLAWADVAKDMRRTRADVLKKLDALPISQEALQENLVGMWGMNRAGMV